MGLGVGMGVGGTGVGLEEALYRLLVLYWPLYWHGHGRTGGGVEGLKSLLLPGQVWRREGGYLHAVLGPAAASGCVHSLLLRLSIHCCVMKRFLCLVAAYRRCLLHLPGLRLPCQPCLPFLKWAMNLD